MNDVLIEEKLEFNLEARAGLYIQDHAKFKKILDFILIICIMVTKELNQGKTVVRRWRKTRGTYSAAMY